MKPAIALLPDRKKRTATEVRAGCFVCSGSDAVWTARNALMVAARHHDDTGHETWAEQILSLRWGESQTERDQGVLL